MRYIIVLLLLLFVSCTSTRLVICVGKIDAPCIQEQLPRDSKILSVKSTSEKDVYEVKYRE
jgi:hypothetical protein